MARIAAAADVRDRYQIAGSNNESVSAFYCLLVPACFGTDLMSAIGLEILNNYYRLSGCALKSNNSVHMRKNPFAHARVSRRGQTWVKSVHPPEHDVLYCSI